MAIQNDDIIIDDEDTKEDDYTDDQLDDDEVDWKAEALKAKGIAKRRATKLAKLKEKNEADAKAKAEAEAKKKPEEKKETPAKPEKKSDKLDYGQKAYLNSLDIKTNEEHEYIQGVMKRTGDDLETIIKDDYVLNKLKSIKEAGEAEVGTPETKKRGGQTAGKDKVDYWLKKGEMPPESEPKLRREYVNAKMEKEGEGSKFAPQSVVDTTTN